MSELTREAGRAAKDLAAANHRTADADTRADIQDLVVALRRAEERLAQRREIGLVIDKHRHVREFRR